MDNNYLQKVGKLIENKSARTKINAELESHILDKIDYYTEIGYSYSEAEQKATEEMGSAEETAVPLNKLHCQRKTHLALTIAAAAAVAGLFYLSEVICSAMNGVHYVYLDFLSVSVFSLYAVLLTAARKKHRKDIAFVLLVSFALQIVLSAFSFIPVWYLSLNVFELFKPMAYMLVTICTSKFGGYTDTLFAYGYVNTSPAVNIAYTIISAVLFLILIVWATVVYVITYREEYMLSTKRIKRYIKTAEILISTYIAVNILFMAVGTVISYSEIRFTIEKSQNNRYDMTDYIINADMTLDYQQQLTELKNRGFEMQSYSGNLQSDNSYAYDQYVCFRGSNILMLYKTYSLTDEQYCLAYFSTDNFSLVEKPQLCTDDDYAAIMQIIEGTKIEEVQNTRIMHKCYNINRSSIDEHGLNDSMDAWFIFENDNCYLSFLDGICEWNSLNDITIQTDYQRQEIIGYIINNSRVRAFDNSQGQVQALLNDLEKNGFDMELISKGGVGEISTYKLKDIETQSFTVECNENLDEYTLHYKAEDIQNRQRAENVNLLFDYEDFEGFINGLSIAAFYENYTYLWHNATEVYSSFDFNSEPGNLWIPTIKFAFSFGNDEDDSLEYFVMEFFKGELVHTYYTQPGADLSWDISYLLESAEATEDNSLPKTE